MMSDMEVPLAASIIVPGNPERREIFRDSDYKPENLLTSFRNFIAGVTATNGILRIGNTAVTDHMAETARLSGIPTIFASAPLPVINDCTLPLSVLKQHRRDRVRAFFLTRNIQRDERGNIRKGDFYYLDRIAGVLSWAEWKPGTRICLSDYRIELVDTSRAGLHLRTGVASANGRTDEKGYRSDRARFTGSGKPSGNGIHAVIPCDAVEPLRKLDGYARTGDEEEDFLLQCALRDFYGVSGEHGKIWDGIGFTTFAGAAAV